ncbi:MAG: Fe-S oxidoreductase [Chloroflexi bacterium B3_Chlor]|nr:MAG: Fe-S oxidoreductase [Chloroflexi bacterium B3_Chlor]
MAHVEEGSLADRLGLQPGDRLISINGHILRDVIDYHFFAADEELGVEVERADQRLAFHVQREYGEEFGLQFTDDVFDGVRRCNNSCAYCFVDQMPPGLRSTLYIKDDDYRYSFLHGNFITLSNWTEEDWERVAEQHLSPLYISVHATALELRRRIFGNPRLPDVRAQLRRLADLGIEVHTQIVVLPGLNDGPYLQQTLDHLTALYPAVRSIGVVPVGLTKYHPAGFRLLTAQEERAIMRQIMPRQAENRRQFGVALIYPSDELYLRAGFPIPSAGEYDGFPQMENGIGLVRQLLGEWEKIKAEGLAFRRGRGVLVCGTLIAPLLGQIVRELKYESPLDIILLPVENEFFGPTVTVSGLLTSGDVVATLGNRSLGDVVFLPRVMFDAAGSVTLDDLTVGDIETRLGVTVTIPGTIRDMVNQFGITP